MQVSNKGGFDMRHKKRKLVAAAIAVGALLVPAVIWIGLGHAGDDGTMKLPAISTIGPEMKPYVLTDIEKKKLHQSVAVPSVPMDLATFAPGDAPAAQNTPYRGLTQAERDKLERWKTRPRRPQRRYEPEKCEAFSTIENIPRAPGIEGLTPQERAKLEAYLKSQDK
jgi:hypothetical protein